MTMTHADWAASATRSAGPGRSRRPVVHANRAAKANIPASHARNSQGLPRPSTAGGVATRSQVSRPVKRTRRRVSGPIAPPYVKPARGEYDESDSTLESAFMTLERYDAIVVGGGHNGLVN